MFAITGSKGFQITFANGWIASVQFGVGNYCEHHRASVWPSSPIRSVNAEFAVIGDSVEDPKGWQTPDEVLQLLNEVAQRPKFVSLNSPTSRRWHEDHIGDDLEVDEVQTEDLLPIPGFRRPNGVPRAGEQIGGTPD